MFSRVTFWKYPQVLQYDMLGYRQALQCYILRYPLVLKCYILGIPVGPQLPYSGVHICCQRLYFWDTKRGKVKMPCSCVLTGYAIDMYQMFLVISSLLSSCVTVYQPESGTYKSISQESPNTSLYSEFMSTMQCLGLIFGQTHLGRTLANITQSRSILCLKQLKRSDAQLWLGVAHRVYIYFFI